MRNRFVLGMGALVLMAGIPARIACAQWRELQAGERVRVRVSTAPKRLIEGLVVSRTPDSVTVQPVKGAPIAWPMAALTEVYVSTGMNHGLGAMRGLVYGGATFGLVGLVVAAAGTEGWGDREDRSTVILMATFATAAVGAGGGLLIGAARGVEGWRRLDDDARISLGVRGRSGIVAIAIPFPSRRHHGASASSSDLRR